MESWQQPKGGQEGEEAKHYSEIEQEPILIDKGYGDSDVYSVKTPEGKECVRKVYSPERMEGRLRDALEESFFNQLPTSGILKKSADAVREVLKSESIKPEALQQVIKRYQRDTDAVSRFVDGNPHIFDYFPEGSKDIEKISFKVLLQGELLDSPNPDSGVIAEGQEFVGGNNLDYIVKCDALSKARRVTFSGEADALPANIPEEFLRLDAVNDMLVEFQHKMMVNIAEILYGDPARADEIGSDYAPVIFHRIHPINVIPKFVKSGEWTFVITDLSTHILLDYLMVLARKLK